MVEEKGFSCVECIWKMQYTLFTGRQKSQKASESCHVYHIGIKTLAESNKPWHWLCVVIYHKFCICHCGVARMLSRTSHYPAIAHQDLPPEDQWRSEPRGSLSVGF